MEECNAKKKYMIAGEISDELEPCLLNFPLTSTVIAHLFSSAGHGRQKHSPHVLDVQRELNITASAVDSSNS